MNKAVKRPYELVESIATIFFSFFIALLISELNIPKSNKWYLIGFSILSIVIIKRLTQSWFKKVFMLMFQERINKSVKLKSTILGRHFIEGEWLGRIYDMRLNSTVYGILDINLGNNGYMISGTLYDTRSNSIFGKFSSRLASYSNSHHSLTCVFEGINQLDGTTNYLYGIAELQVSQIDKHPTDFIGKISDIANKETLSVELRKISSKTSSRHKVLPPNQFEALIEEYKVDRI